MYKLRKEKDFYKPKEDLKQTDFVIVDFETAVKRLGCKVEQGNFKRKMRTLQADRISKEYPKQEVVAKMFGRTSMPPKELEIQPSSQAATQAYIHEMYGITARITNDHVIY